MLINKENDNRPYLKIQIFDKTITALVDSGANCTIAGAKGAQLIESLGKKFKIPIFPSRLKFMKTADGALQKVSGVINLNICINKICRKVYIYLVPNVKHNLILGSDCCRLFEFKLDFRKNTCHLSNECFTTEIVELNTEQFSPSQEIELKKIIAVFKKLARDDKLGRTNKLVHVIDTGDTRPFKQRQYRLSPYMMAELNKELDRMLALKVVEPSNSPWSSPVLLVKKSSGDFRLCFDGRKLNSVTKSDSYPLPYVDRILSRLRDAKCISSIDLKQAFWQIPLSKDSKEKTAFSVPGRGLFHFNVLPFGLSNAAQAQQRLMDAIFGPELEPHVFVYLDDLIIVSSTFEHHVTLLNEVAKRLADANLTINIKKCQFFKPSLKYLGFIVDKDGLRTNPEKVEAMVNYPVPSTATEIKRFVGMCSWYRRFIPHFSTLMSPINNLLKGKKKGQKIQWNRESDEAFQKVKDALISAPVLSSPNFDKPFFIQTDASNSGLGAVLTQNIDDEEKVIAFASRSLTKAERNYSVTERECLAVVFAVDKFRPYVEGVKFTIITDHHSLLWLNRMKDPAGKLARWSVKLNQFSFDLLHRKGKFNVVPDALSRISPKIAALDAEFYLGVNITDPDKSYVELRNKILSSPNKYPLWKVENNYIFKFIPHKSELETNIPDWKLLVPKEQRQNILKICHDAPTASHFGFFKTIARVNLNYYWPKMRRFVQKYVARCEVCNAQKAPNVGQMGLMGKRKTVRFPFQIISIDIIGPLPRSTKGFSYILSITDWFSKYTVLEPLREATSKKIAKFVEDNIFLVYGVPQYIIADNGKQFIGKEFTGLCNEYKVQKIWYTAKYHPQANPVERYNRIINTAIRSYIKTSHKKWDAELPKIGFAIRTAVSEVTGYSPAFINFGRIVPISGDFYGKNEETISNLSAYNRKQYADNLGNLQEIYDKICKGLHQAHERNKKTYNFRKRDIEFFVNDMVWKRNKVLSDAKKDFAKKLAPKYVLCKIKRKLSKLTYELVDENNQNIGIWHIKDLKPYNGESPVSSDTED